MLVDRDLLERRSSFTSDGIEERAFHFHVDSDECFGLLYRPSEPSSLGFVVCHSYSLEFLTLRRLERAIARALASLGHPVLAFHSRGYGDSTGLLADATLDRHRADVAAAVARLKAETGTSEIGLVGARFGSLMAGTVARDGDIARLVLVSPEFSGARYFRRLIRSKHMVDLASTDGGHRRSLEDLVDVLHEGGTLDLLGYALHGHLYNSMAEVDLAADIGSFAGEALVIEVSKRAVVSKAAQSFANLTEANGGKARLESLREPPGVSIGGPAFVSTSDPNVREDLQEPVVDQITTLVEEWMTD